MPKKKKIKTTEQEISPLQSAPETDENFAISFAKSAMGSLYNPIFFNPIWQNEILKDINMHPTLLDRDKVEELIANPRVNEEALRNLAQYLENYIMQFKRILHYFATILTFDHYLEPTNADEEDMKSPSFKRSYKKALDWLDDIDPKKTFPEIMKMVMLEDAKFYYLRQSKNGIRLQEMPSQYCMITHKNDLGYQYAFNMMYFLNPGVNLEDYDPIFTEYYVDFLTNKDSKEINPIPGVTTQNKNGRYFYWQELDPSKAKVFKFDENHAGITPPLMALFIDAVEIATFKNLLKTKTQLEVWKIILNKIPMHSDSKGSTTKNNFAIDGDTAGKFSAMMQQAMPEGVKVVTSPLESEAIDFSQAENKNNIVGVGEQNFWNSGGVTPVMFGEVTTTGSGLKSSQQTDYYFVKHMYKQFETFVNYQLKQATGKFRFKVHFEGSMFDEEDRFDRAIQAAQYGAPVSYLASAMGKSQSEFSNLINFEEAMGIKDRMKPLMSSHTLNGNDQGGAPEKKNLTPSGEKTRENGSNSNR